MIPLAKRSSAEAGWKMVSDAHGLAATTRWRRLAVRNGSTLVEFQPLTGRTHQIRAHAREAFGRGIVGDRVYGIPGGPMLLHASRLVVPRDGKPGDRRDCASSRLFRRVARCGLRTSSDSGRRAERKLPRCNRPRRAERKQGRDRGAAARRPVRARPASRRLRAAEDDRRKPRDRSQASSSSPLAASALRRRTGRCAPTAGGDDRCGPYGPGQAQADAAEPGQRRRSGWTRSASEARSSRGAER